MVTLPRAERLELLRRSLTDYGAQNWSNRELIVVVDPRGATDARHEALAAIEALASTDVRIVKPENELSLGALRNLSVAHASGEILCQWDDDDLQHPERIATQYEAMVASGRRVSYLQEALQLWLPDHRLYWTNWAPTPAGALPGTLMCDARVPVVYPEDGPLSRLSEDVSVLEDLERREPIHRLQGAAYLYVYTAHAANTTTPAHHQMLARNLGISRKLLQRREELLREKLGWLRLERDVSVESPNGCAFRIAADRAD